MKITPYAAQGAAAALILLHEKAAKRRHTYPAGSLTPHEHAKAKALQTLLTAYKHGAEIHEAQHSLARHVAAEFRMQL